MASSATVRCFAGFMIAWLFSADLIAQEQKNFRPTIFKYNETESAFTLNMGAGAGGASPFGVLFNLQGELDVYHIYAAGMYIYDWQGDYVVTATSALIGYRYRKNHWMLSVSSGICRQKFKCISGENYDCYNYKEETINAVPLNAAVDIILSDQIALGANYHFVSSQREDLSGLMVVLKIGAFRNIY